MARRSRCPGHGRHWFTYYGAPGSSAPVCQRCGAENPGYRPEDDDRRESDPQPLGAYSVPSSPDEEA
jgi:hypothetical protein